LEIKAKSKMKKRQIEKMAITKEPEGNIEEHKMKRRKRENMLMRIEKADAKETLMINKN
jgi:hypothetical protein